MSLRSKLGRLKRAVLAPLPSGTPAPDTGPAPVRQPSWADDPPSPWGRSLPDAGVTCNICGWTGEAFVGRAHCEAANCPQCGSIARDRFLFHCFVARTPESLGARVLETSPRLGDDYRTAMATWFDYTCSDFDERAHKGAVQLDLQEIDRPDGTFDVILTPHVLEHVPDTDRALDEIHRVLAPEGRMYLQVPVLQGATAPPEQPEFHGDDTPVFWRFGFDLTGRLRDHGFTTTLLATDGFIAHLDTGAPDWPEATSPEFDVTSMTAGAIRADLTSVADDATAARLGLEPAYMFLTWEARK
ncbi:MAG TPA: class I SAM-dependent methyltransferase [Acidimicrobiales bacterium]|nr:class I SAM-dependent methyltransferase [Acidimicrobiales bacterium]